MSVVISFTEEDQEAAQSVQKSLSDGGRDVSLLKASPPESPEEKKQNGRAITESKVFIPILSKGYLDSRSHMDELALAVFSDKHMFPIAVQEQDIMLDQMDMGMKLQLKALHWTSITSSGEPDLKALAEAIDEALEQAEEEEKVVQELDPPKRKRPCTTTRPNSARRAREMSRQSQEAMETGNLWDEHFSEEDTVVWERFWEVVMDKHGRDIESLCKGSDIRVLESALQRDFKCISGASGIVLAKEHYLAFCTVDGQLFPLWNRIEDCFAQTQNIKRVFDVESTVRFDAIVDLSKSSSSTVLDALKALLHDPDPNVRAVASISLARSGCSDHDAIQVLMGMLNDGDRIVRQSAGLALGHMKVEAAIPKLVNLWRNDFISTVRESAQKALQNIGGPEAEKAMRITKLLDQELKDLSTKNE